MKDARYVLTGLILAGILTAGILLIKKYQGAPASVTVEQDLKIKGPQGAPIQIVEYSDFECPACAKAEIPLRKILSDPDFAGKIQFVYRHFPLSGHRWSGLAHQAAECANKYGKFWEFHDKLYSEQSLWSGMESPTENFLRYAKELNLPADEFGFCLASPEIRRRVLDEKKRGEELQIRSTPTFFINGERLVGPVELENRGPQMIRKALGLPEKSAVPQTVPVIPPMTQEAAASALQAGESAISTQMAAAAVSSSQNVSTAVSGVPAKEKAQ